MNRTQNPEDLKKRFKTGKTMVFIADIVAAICFLLAYFGTDESLYLLLSVVLAASAFGVLVVFSRIEKRLNDVMK